MLTYFYIALYTTSLSLIILNRHWFSFITVFNAYITQLLSGRAIFLSDLQDLKFFSKVARIIIEVKSNFTNEVKQRGN